MKMDASQYRNLETAPVIGLSIQKRFRGPILTLLLRIGREMSIILIQIKRLPIPHMGLLQCLDLAISGY